MPRFEVLFSDQTTVDLGHREDYHPGVAGLLAQAEKLRLADGRPKADPVRVDRVVGGSRGPVRTPVWYRPGAVSDAEELAMLTGGTVTRPGWAPGDRLPAPGEPALPVPSPSRYGAEFDGLAERWAALEAGHGDRPECAEGCASRRAAQRLESEMVDALVRWRTR